MLLIVAMYGDLSSTSGYTLLLINPYFPREKETNLFFIDLANLYVPTLRPKIKQSDIIFSTDHFVKGKHLSS